MSEKATMTTIIGRHEDRIRPKYEERYGRYIWCIKVPKTISGSREIILFADEVTNEQGALTFWQTTEPTDAYMTERVELPKKHLTLTLGPGMWIACYAASCIDTSAIAVTHWDGEVLDEFGEVREERRREKQKEHKGKNEAKAPMRHEKAERQPIAAKLRYTILARDGYACVLCGSKGARNGWGLELDHIVPASRGGKATADNLRTLCKMCNRGKGDSVGAE